MTVGNLFESLGLEIVIKHFPEETMNLTIPKDQEKRLYPITNKICSLFDEYNRLEEKIKKLQSQQDRVSGKILSYDKAIVFQLKPKSKKESSPSLVEEMKLE